MPDMVCLPRVVCLSVLFFLLYLPPFVFFMAAAAAAGLDISGESRQPEAFFC